MKPNEIPKPPLTALSTTINGKNYKIDVPPTTSLLSFIRTTVGLKGTKACCYEGGCGVCTVVVSCPDLENGGVKSLSAHACQIPIYSCDGWVIQTIEHLGNKQDGYSKLQNALHGFYGTQCGFCSPGMVMTMHGNEVASGKLKMEEIEKLLDGNLCRCTGYRPILDAFKSFASDAPKELKAKLTDIEESYKNKCSGNKCCGNECGSQENSCFTMVSKSPEEISLFFDGVGWYRPLNLEGVYSILNQKDKDQKVKMVVGNTSKGVFKDEGPFDIMIDLAGIPELWSIDRKTPIAIGPNVSLSRCIAFFKQGCKRPRYKHLEQIYKHWEYVANVGIRNLGSWAGNLMMKHREPWFPSDIFLTLLAADAKVVIGTNGVTHQVELEDFLKVDMSKSVIISLILPPLENVSMRTFKITPRAVNAHAYVNAAFKFELDEGNGFKVLSKPNILFNGISSTFNRASKAEAALTGIRLTDKAGVLAIVRNLGNEVKPDYHPNDSSQKYRTELSQALLYKTILGLIGERSSSPYLRSGGFDLVRPLSKGSQKYDGNKDTWPVGQPVTKLESTLQVSGEAQFIDDTQHSLGELFGSFVQSSVARAKIKSIDASECLALEGVVDFITAKDVPGVNSFVKDAGSKPDPVFVSSQVSYAGQSLGLVVAESSEIADKGAALVKVEYEDVQKPVLTIRDGIKSNRAAPVMPSDKVIGKPDEAFKKAKHVLEGEFDQGTQFHFPMEPISALVVPSDLGYEVFVATQWPTEAQKTVALNLDIPNNAVNVVVKRLGGAYGHKISRVHVTSSAAAIAAHKLRKPVRVITKLSTNMNLVGWREPYYSKYKVGFNDDGMLQCIEARVYSDPGHVANEVSVGMISNIENAYHCPNWRIRPYAVTTDTAANTWCRTPGHVEIDATMEVILDRVAYYLKRDPINIREINLSTKERPPMMHTFHEENLVTTKIFPQLKKDADIQQRREQVVKFNTENRWKKRGLAVEPLHYQMNMNPFFKYNVQVVIYAEDGTIAITHGGIEMGQGINTKCAQVVAKILGAPLDMIKVKATNTFTGANSVVTGGSYGSDLNAHGMEVCCKLLRERMDVVAEKMKKDVTWAELVDRCFNDQVDLSERFFTYHKTHPKSYDIWAAACLEVELDVLTGQFHIVRADIIEDCGRSMSPYIDVGQVEGSFIMGLGLYTSEVLRFDEETGQKLSTGTWNYKPPTALDIPIDLRITFLSNSENEAGVLRAKATGEPALCMSFVVVSALREAIASARENSGTAEWFEIDTPLTVEKIQQLCLTHPNKFAL